MIKFKQKMSEETFKQKYMINGEESPDEVFVGIAEELSSVERSKAKRNQWKEIFHEQMSSGKLIPAGRILANARPNAQMPYYNNCYTIGIEDSIKGIGEAQAEDLTISATGGGVGINFSNIRPKDTPTSKGGESSGPLSFMGGFDYYAHVIHTGGARRSAHIAILNVDHPDIEAFITCKQGDKNKAMTQFNISVGVTDAFIEAVDNDLPWDLVFEGKIFKTVQAKYLYELMTKNAFTHNEPGILNLDIINKFNNGYYGFDIFEVNPCFTGDTIVAVADGRNGVSIKELAEKNEQFQVYSGKLKGQGNRPSCSKWKPEIKNATAFKTGDRKVIEVFLSNGTSFKCTPEHMLARPDGSYIEAQNSVGIELENFYTFSNKMTAKSYRHINSKTNGFAKQYRMMWDFKNGEYSGKEFNVDHLDNDSTNDSYNNLQLITLEEHKEKSKKTILENNPINRMRDKERFNILQRQKNILGNAKRYDWPDERIEEELSKLPELKPVEDLNCYLDERVFVEETKELGTEAVYDLTVEDNHNFYILTKTDDDNYLNSSGVLVHNCGEIVMPPYSLCCLSSINLTKFIVNPFTDDAFFDIMEFERTVEVGIRFLDNVLDATKYPLQKIEDMSKKWRRIGLGFTGLGDAFTMLGIKYGGSESRELSHVIGAALRDESYRASIDLAREKGPFPSCDKKKLAEANFIKLLPEGIQKDIRKYGLRNIAMNTTAPTGTTSLTLGQNCSSGIEPIFSLEYDRNVRTGRGDDTKKERVMDYAWMKYLEHLEDLEYEGDIAVPEAFVTTFDIDVYDAIDIQAIFQIYIDHSISKTLNLPVGTTYETYNELFRYAYKKGLKGFTSFNPEGSMKGILEAPKSESTEEELKRTEEGVIIRPKKVPCDIQEVKFGGKNYLVLVGMLDGSPYEVFVTYNEDKKEYPMNGKKKGIIQKVKKGKYNLVIPNGEDKVYIEDITNKFDPIYLTLGRFISMSLRSNHPLQFIVEQLLKDGNFGGFEKTVGRVLKKYIKEGEKVKSNTNCPECGNTELRYQEGCLSCPDCGWSKCS